MKLTDLKQPIAESDLAKFHSMIKDRVKAHVEADKLISKNHKWKFEIGDVFMGIKTGKTYKIVHRGFQKRIDRDENFKKVGEAYLSPVYYYETPDGDKGQFWEDRLVDSKSMKRIAKAGDKTE